MVDVSPEALIAKIRVVSREKNECMPHIINFDKIGGYKAFYRTFRVNQIAAVAEIKPFQDVPKYKLRFPPSSAKILQVSIHHRRIPVLQNAV